MKGLEFFELLHAATEILVRAETRVQICLQHLFDELDANDPGTEAEQIDVVVLHALMRSRGFHFLRPGLHSLKACLEGLV